MEVSSFSFCTSTEVSRSQIAVRMGSLSCMGNDGLSPPLGSSLRCRLSNNFPSMVSVLLCSSDLRCHWFFSL